MSDKKAPPIFGDIDPFELSNTSRVPPRLAEWAAAMAENVVDGALEANSVEWLDFLAQVNEAGYEWSDEDASLRLRKELVARHRFRLLARMEIKLSEAALADGEAEADPEADADAEAPPEVPQLGERLISFFCTRDTAEAVLGDLEEAFNVKVEKRGIEAARRWYWWQVSSAGVSFGWRWLQRGLAIEAILRRIG